MPIRQMVNRAGPRSVALETTLLVHGVPRGEGVKLAAELAGVVRGNGAEPCVVGVVSGVATVGLTDSELGELLEAVSVPKANTANLGVLLHWGSHAATTVSTTMELAAAAGVRVFATGGLGGVHPDIACHLDVSSDLAAFTRFPVAVVTAGVKSLLDVVGTREVLETLGVPVVGFGTDRFPAFYLRESDAKVDARFDDPAMLATFVASELARTGRGVVVCNPIPHCDEISRSDWEKWLDEAQARADDAGVRGRDVTPFILGALHEISAGATLRANIALVKANAALAAKLCAAMPPR